MAALVARPSTTLSPAAPVCRVSLLTCGSGAGSAHTSVQATNRSFPHPSLESGGTCLGDNLGNRIRAACNHHQKHPCRRIRPPGPVPNREPPPPPSQTAVQKPAARDPGVRGSLARQYRQAQDVRALRPSHRAQSKQPLASRQSGPDRNRNLPLRSSPCSLFYLCRQRRDHLALVRAEVAPFVLPIDQQGQDGLALMQHVVNHAKPTALPATLRRKASPAYGLRASTLINAARSFGESRASERRLKMDVSRTACSIHHKLQHCCSLNKRDQVSGPSAHHPARREKLGHSG